MVVPQPLEHLQVELIDGIAVVRLHRPAVLNALNRALLGELSAVVSSLEADIQQRGSVRAVLITGSGEKAFAAGADVSEFTQLSADQTLSLSRSGQDLFARLEALPVPVLAAINGFALGGGLELALACHLRLAADTAKLGLPETKLGLLPGYGGTQRLTRLVGPAKAVELILTAEPVDATTAERLGIVNAVVPAAELFDRSLALLRLMTRHSRESLAAALEAIRTGVAGQDGFAIESRRFAEVLTTPNGREGVAAFLAKRKPNFQ